MKGLGLNSIWWSCLSWEKYYFQLSIVEAEKHLSEVYQKWCSENALKYLITLFASLEVFTASLAADYFWKNVPISCP